MLIIRKYLKEDCEHLAELFFKTVHTVNVKDYTEEELNAWADGKVNLEEWNRSFLEHYTVVAEKDGKVAGFGDIDKTGYLDRLYVHKDYQRQKIATAICDELEKAVDVDKIVTHASITAKPFFIKRGYTVIKEQQVVRHGVSLTNYVMELKR